MHLIAKVRLPLLVVLAVPLFNLPRADADLVTYSWSGFSERSASDPFGFGGDGLGATIGDGMPFTLSVDVDSDAIDMTVSANQGRFVVDSADLTIGGTPAVVSINSGSALTFDDDSAGEDMLTFAAQITFNGHSELWTSGVRVDGGTFELFDGGEVDLPPVFGSASSVGTPSDFGGLAYRSIIPFDTPVNSTAVPEPSAAVLLSLVSFLVISANSRRRAVK